MKLIRGLIYLKGSNEVCHRMSEELAVHQRFETGQKCGYHCEI